MREQVRWRHYHLDQIEAHLARVEAAARQEVARLADHCASVLTVLNHARQVHHLQDRVINLLLALDPWPVRWGYGSEWALLLHSGAEAAEAQGDPRRQAMLLVALANCRADGGQMAVARAAAQRAFEIALQTGMLDILAGALDLAVMAALRLGETAAAQALLERAAGIIAQADWTKLPAMARVCFSHARTLRRLGRLEEALHWADRAVRLVEGAGPEERHAGLLADACNVRGVMYWAAVRYAEAARDLARAHEIYRRIGDQDAAMRVAGTLGLVYWSLGELDRAAQIIEEVLRQADAEGSHLQAAINVGNLGLVELCRGRLRPALACFERQLTLATQAGDPHEAMRALGNRGIVRWHRREYAAAMADLKQEAEFAGRSGMPEGLICNYVAQARCLAALGQTDAAHTLAQDTIAMARRTGSAALIIIALRCLAEQVQETHAARAALLEALALARQTGRRLDEAACLLALAALAPEPEQGRLWRDGARLLAAIGAHAWLRGRSPQDPPRIVLVA
ncbi:MAG: tetratricopeptide repeat protein [Anaerolineae bacterium]